MDKKIFLFLASLLAGTAVYSQVTSMDADVDAELNQLYSGQAVGSAGSVPQQNLQLPPAAPAPAQSVSQAPVYQAAPVTQQSALMQIQKQPTTLIEASPLTESRAEAIRKGRQEEELRTEAKIVEKLEQSRMEDEKKRAAILFGDKFDALQNSHQAPPAPVAPLQAPVQPMQAPLAPAPAPAPIILQNEKEDTRDVVREEIRAALDDEKNAITAPVEVRYFGGTVGITEYPDTSEIKSNFAFGAAFGTRYDQLLVEGSFLYSNATVDIINYARGRMTDSYDVNQYTGAMSAKYQMFSGVVRPVIGGTIAYSYRRFTLNNNNYYYGSSGSEDTGNSHAVDLGVIGGADLEFSPKFSLGAEFKYMFNLSSRVNAKYPNSTYGYVGTPIEKLNYYVMGLTARVNF